MTDADIRAIALQHGFKYKEQLDGTMDLNPYVYDFARYLLAAAAPTPEVEPVLVSYGVDMETCTLSYKGEEYYFDRIVALTPEVEAYSKEWCMRMAQLEGDQEIGAGRSTLIPTPEVEPVAEHVAFEKWASSEKMSMHMHPPHYLFLDSKTYTARQGWKAGVKYGQSIHPAPPSELVKAAEKLLDRIDRGFIFRIEKEELRAELDKVKS